MIRNYVCTQVSQNIVDKVVYLNRKWLSVW